MKLRCVLAMVGLAWAVYGETDESARIRVTGDRVNLRTRPDINATALEPAMRGEELLLLEQVEGWVGVAPPEYIDCWVSGEYINNGVVVPEKLNVRAGPSLNYNVLAVVYEGDKVESRGGFNDWLKIAPPPGCKVWISDQFVELIEPPAPEPVVEPVPVVEPPLPTAVPPLPTPPEVVKKEKEEELPPLVLVIDEGRTQGEQQEIPGVLRRANPGLFKMVLVENGYEESICLVRGNEQQLEKYLGRVLLVKGRMYWAKGVDLPVLVPSKIHLDPIIKE